MLTPAVVWLKENNVELVDYTVLTLAAVSVVLLWWVLACAIA